MNRFMGSAPVSFFYSLDQFLVSFVGQVTVYYKQGVDNPRDPERQGQEDAEDGLYWFATQEDGQGRQKNGE